MKSNQPKSNDTTASETISQPETAPQPKNLAFEASTQTQTLSNDQIVELEHNRLLRDIRVKTQACLSYKERERRKFFRNAWRKYWQFLPLFLGTWLVGLACLLPRYFLPVEAVVVATPVEDVRTAQRTALENLLTQVIVLENTSQISENKEDITLLSSSGRVSPDLAMLLAKNQQALVDEWLARLDKGVLPDELPQGLADWTGGKIPELYVIDGGSWENGKFETFSEDKLPPERSTAIQNTAQNFCTAFKAEELTDELVALLAEVAAPSLVYSEALTREFAQRNPRTAIRPSNQPPFLGQTPFPHQIYRPYGRDVLKSITARNLLRGLGNKGFWVTALVLLAFLLAYTAIAFVLRVSYITEMRRLILLGVLLVLEFVSVALCANYISLRHEIPLPLLLSCLPLAFFPAVIGNLLDERMAIVTATLMAMLLPLQLNLPSEQFPLFYFSLLVTLAAVPCFRQITRRLEFLSRGLIFGLVLTAAEVAFLLSDSNGLSGKDFVIALVFLLAAGLANGLLNGCFCILAMSVLEWLFRLPTALTLTEVSNLDSPLLERLRQDAPGTYEHSVAVADLAVSGAKTIGANAKLAYAMALYHDIGKLYSPKHFTENLKPGDESPHQRHTPEDSCEYLREHARFGIKLARKYHLPSLIYPAILQHHGNTIMASFYQQACRMAEEKGLPPPDKTRFRYDQDTPASLEVALIMLADSCEAATRSITHRKRDVQGEAKRLTDALETWKNDYPSATPEEINELCEKWLAKEEMDAQENFRGQIEARVKSVIQGKFIDGQFELVNLTTHQLSLLTQDFVESLLDKNHTRLEYKK